MHPVDDLIPNQMSPEDKPSVKPLPLRKDLPADQTAYVKPRDINDTYGGRRVHKFIFRDLGFILNSGTSIFFTYYVNSKQWMKTTRNAVVTTIESRLPGMWGRAVKSVAEILLMMGAGTIVTAFMAPIARNKERLAYWVNQRTGKDTDVLPDYLRPMKTPETVEDRIEQELQRRVNYKQTAGDVWKARFTSMLVPIFGDAALAKVNSVLESKDIWSMDTVGWGVGSFVYDRLLPKPLATHLNNFFSQHGASIKDMKENNLENYKLLDKHENRYNKGGHNDDRMMVADQARLFGKEVGWTFVLAKVLEKCADYYQNSRVDKQQRRAVDEIKKMGLIPQGYKMEVSKEGRVTLFEPSISKEAHVDSEARAKNWSKDLETKQRKEKAGSYTASVNASRAEPAAAGVAP